MCNDGEPIDGLAPVHTALRTLALTIAATATLAACSDDSRPVPDVLAEDSTLAREVLAANTDSLMMPVDTALTAAPEIAAVQPAPASSVTSGAEESSDIPAARPVSITSPTEHRRVTAARSSDSRSVPAPRRPRVVSPSPMPVADKAPTRLSNTGEPSAETPSNTAPADTRMRGSALIPAGSELVLASDQRVCASMSHAGDTFQVRIAEDVVGPIGVVIPRGAVATAQIGSLESDFDLDIRSLSVAGRTYPIDAGATFTQVEKVRTSSRKRAAPIGAGAALGATIGGVAGRDVKAAVIGAAGGAIAGALASRQTYRTDSCVPEGGRITTRLAGPLRIALSE